MDTTLPWAWACTSQGAWGPASAFPHPVPQCLNASSSPHPSRELFWHMIAVNLAIFILGHQITLKGIQFCKLYNPNYTMSTNFHESGVVSLGSRVSSLPPGKEHRDKSRSISSFQFCQRKTILTMVL